MGVSRFAGTPPPDDSRLPFLGPRQPARDMAHEPPGAQPALAARSIAPRPPLAPRDEPPSVGGPQWPALTARRALSGLQLPADATAAGSAPLHHLVAREVARQIAAIKPPASPAASKPPRPSPASIDLPSDDVVRRLLSRMRALSQEERFRSGLLR
jgi:hypothetical protein